MKLISTKIHDYYDGCINQYGYETDGNIFIREPQSIQIRTKMPKTNDHLGFLAKSLTINNFSARCVDKKMHTFQPFNILVSGKMYGGIVVIDTIAQEIINYFYSYDQVMNFTETKKIDIIDKNKTSRWYFDGSPRITKQNLLKHFDINLDYMQDCIEHKLVIAFVYRNKITSMNECSVTFNGELKSKKFYSVMDAFTIYQEISMYVDGCLSSPGNQLIEIDDKYKIEGHGFDKYSFKTPPTIKH